MKLTLSALVSCKTNGNNSSEFIAVAFTVSTSVIVDVVVMLFDELLILKYRFYFVLDFSFFSYYFLIYSQKKVLSLVS